MTQSANLPPSNKYTDEQILAAFQSATLKDTLIVKWFLKIAKNYSMGCWKKKYSRLHPDEWDIIFADTNFKLIKQVQKGLIIKKARLLSYYTTLVKYTILDFIENKKRITATSISPIIPSPTTKNPHSLETTESALLIKKKLEQITGNKQQVAVLLLVTKGYSHKEIVRLTNYKSDRASINAYLKGKQKIVRYIHQYPEEAKKLKALLLYS